VDEGQITIDDPQESPAPGCVCPESKLKIEVTDKTLDFLGIKTLKEFARVARQEQLRPSRHARPFYGH
jgi:hypothetical protein